VARPGVSLFALAALAALAASGCGDKKPVVPKDVQPASAPASEARPWPAPPNPLELTRKAGLEPKTHELFAYQCTRTSTSS
jgi:hypothetical protein